MDTPTALQRAIKEIGSQQALADALGVKSPSITDWHRGRVPADRCPAVEALTGVPCEELRPDLAWSRDGSGNVTGYVVQLSAA